MLIGLKMVGYLSVFFTCQFYVSFETESHKMTSTEVILYDCEHSFKRHLRIFLFNSYHQTT